MRLLASICLAGLTVAAVGQTVDQAAPDNRDRATVYVYRPGQYAAKLRKLTVLTNGVELARVQNGRFFVVKLPPGEYAFSDKKVDHAAPRRRLEAGKEYYLQVGWMTGFWKAKRALTWVEPEQGRSDVATLKPLDPEHIRDRVRVVNLWAEAGRRGAP